MLCLRKHFGHNRKCRVTQVGLCYAKLFYAHAAIQTAGAVYFYTIGEEIYLNRRSLCMDAVITVDYGV